MPIVAVSINKTMPFQGAQEVFSNVYTMDSGPDLSDDWSGVAQDLADLEQTIHASVVEWQDYRVWNLEGTQIERVIIDAGDLTGEGQLVGDNVYHECAVLVRWPLTRSPVLRRRRWLSKWLHVCALSPSSAESVGGYGPIPQTARDLILNSYAIPLREYGSDGTAGVRFTDGSGERPGAPFIGADGYLEHRQLHHG